MMSRRNKRVTLRWLFMILVMFGAAVACNVPTPQADDGMPDGVRAQVYGDCLIFTHDTSYGASIAVWCDGNGVSLP